MRLPALIPLLLLLAACSITVERDADPKTVAARTFEEVLSTGDIARASEFYDASFVNHGLTRDIQLADDMAALKAWHDAFPDLEMKVEQIVAEEDMVSVLWVAQGTNTAAAAGLPATGRKARLRGITIWRIVDGKIKEEWSAYDQLSLLQQLGLLPSGGQ
jgi:steroid delta-isomerase-like uncharacterized protein